MTGATPTGSVQFKDGAANLGSPVALSGGVATLSTSALTQGTHSITAIYSGDSGNATSTWCANSQPSSRCWRMNAAMNVSRSAYTNHAAAQVAW